MSESNGESPLVSVIMPSFNSERFIGEAIDSVLDQTFINWELLVVDGQSWDGTRGLIKSYCKRDNRIKLIENKDDRGPSQARSLGFGESRGEYIAFLDSDDLWHPEKIERQLNFLRTKKAKFCFTQFKKIDEDGNKSRYAMGIHTKNVYRQYLRRRGISNSSVLVHRSCMTEEVVATYGKYHGEDTLWWLLIMKNGITAHGIVEPLIFYRTVDGSLSSKVAKNQLTVWHSYRNELGLNPLSAFYYYSLYVIDVLCRRLNFKLKTLLRG